MKYLNLTKIPHFADVRPKFNFKTFSPGEIHDNRTPRFSTLVIVFSGILRFTENGETVEVKPGEYYIQRAMTQQCGIPVDEPPVYFFFHFDGVFDDSPSSEALPIRGVFDIKQLKTLCDHCFLTRSQLSFEAYYLFLRILRRLHNQNTANKNDLAERVANYISKNIVKIKSFLDVSDALNYSGEYLSRVFKRKFGITPHDYIIKERLNFAQEMLLSTNLSITQIAETSGYCDVTAFSRAFKRDCGETPSQWRSQNNFKFDG